MRMVRIIVPVRPMRSPNTPKMKPPTDQPIRNAAVTQLPISLTLGSLVEVAWMRSWTDCARTRLKRFWSIVSKSHPRAAMTRTTQQYRSRPWYQRRLFLFAAVPAALIRSVFEQRVDGELETGQHVLTRKDLTT